MTALDAKYLINQYYGTGPSRSYWVGCSTGGRQGMVMSQNFPSFFDGIELEKHGITRGRVLTRGEGLRETKNASDPDVVWEGEFPDAASLARYEEIAGKHPDYMAVVQKMRTVTKGPAERRYYQLHSTR